MQVELGVLGVVAGSASTSGAKVPQPSWVSTDTAVA